MRYNLSTMNIVTVIPITKTRLNYPLNYFSAGNIPVGAIVSVPLRSKMIYGIVSESKPAEKSTF